MQRILEQLKMMQDEEFSFSRIRAARSKLWEMTRGYGNLLKVASLLGYSSTHISGVIYMRKTLTKEMIKKIEELWNNLNKLQRFVTKPIELIVQIVKAFSSAGVSYASKAG